MTEDQILKQAWNEANQTILKIRNMHPDQQNREITLTMLGELRLIRGELTALRSVVARKV